MSAKILCIDDEPELRETIVEELTDVGYETVEADNGRTGLAAIVENQPDLVLCDINMPEMDGTQLLQNLRVNHPDLADMPFIFLTAQADRSAVLNGKKLGADDYLTKPIDFELLIATVEARLGQVRRMEAKQEQQLVKLYRTVSGGGPPDGAKQAGDDPAPSPAGNSQPITPATREKLVSMAGSKEGHVTAGRMQFIGLDVIRDEFGDRWPALETRIFDIAEKTIARRIDNVDVFRRDESNNYVICFAQLDEAEASFKADRIANEIREKILGECGQASEPPPPVGKAPQATADTDHHDIASRASQALRSEVHSIPLSPEEAQETESVFDLVQARIEQAASIRRQSDESTLKEVFETGKLRTCDIDLRNGSPTPFKLAGFDERTQLKIDGLIAGRRNTGDLMAKLSMMQLGQVAEQIYARTASSQTVIMVDITISTLENRRQLEPLLELLQSFDEPVRNAIALKLTGISEDVYPAKLSGLATLVRPFCRLVAVELGRPTLGTIDPAEMRAPIVACRFETIAPLLEKTAPRIKTLAQDVHEKKARFLIHAIPDMENKVQLSKLGVDLLSLA